MHSLEHFAIMRALKHFGDSIDELKVEVINIKNTIERLEQTAFFSETSESESEEETVSTASVVSAPW